MPGKMNLMPSSANATAGETMTAMKAMLGQFVPTGNPDGKQIVTLRIDLLDAYPKQNIFGMRELEELSENIREVGVTDPIHVRAKGMRYEILSGHRRSAAAKLAGLEEIPAIVENVDDADADLIFCDNLYHRKTLLPSERGAAYKVQVEALQRKAGTNGPSVSAVAAQMGTNRKEVYRYIKLTELVPELLDMVDEDQMPMRAGVAIASLPYEEQYSLLEVMDEISTAKIDLNKASALVSKYKEQGLTEETIREILAPTKAKKKKEEFLKVPMERVQHFFSEAETPEQMIETVVNALDFYNRDLER